MRDCLFSTFVRLGIGKPDAKGDSIYNGASDNAIGTAMVLELAAALKKGNLKPKRTIVFLMTSAEEMGHWGSLWYVKHTPQSQKETVANINLDGFNRYGKTKDMVIIGAGHTELEDYFAKEVKKQGRYISPDPNAEQNYYFGSDHLSFAKAGIPGLFCKHPTGHTLYKNTSMQPIEKTNGLHKNGAGMLISRAASFKNAGENLSMFRYICRAH